MDIVVTSSGTTKQPLPQEYSCLSVREQADSSEILPIITIKQATHDYSSSTNTTTTSK